jgi:DNA-binding NarL/FixJ family response regulator
VIVQISSATPPTVAKRNILVVEDHLLFRAMLVQLINTEPGLTACGEADNVQDALTLIEATHPDAVIVDLSLKGSSGLELIKVLRARRLALPALVLSMSPESLYAERAIGAGAQGYVSKQESPTEVVAALRTVLAGRIYVNQRFSGTMQERLGHGGQAVPPSGIDSLSNRELEVFQLLGQGLTLCEIARRLNLEPTELDSYRVRFKERLGTKNAAEFH